MIDEVRQSFLGKQLQTPPVFSAKQIDGKRAYEFARAGEAIELKQNEIEIFDFTVDSSEFPKVHFSIKCSKGTYIRSIASDFGKALKSGGTLVELRRTGSGEFDIKDALTVDEAIKMIEESEIWAKTFFSFKNSLFLSSKLPGPSGGTGRRAGFKIQFFRECRFDPGLGY